MFEPDAENGTALNLFCKLRSANTTYYYRLRATNAVDDSPYSAEVNVHTPATVTQTSYLGHPLGE